MPSYGNDAVASSARQLTLSFEQAVDERDQRRAMIDSLPLSARARRLLATLDDLGGDKGCDGRTRLKVTREAIAAAMRVCPATVVRARRDGCRTAFLRVWYDPGEAAVYVIDWAAIWAFWANEPRPRVGQISGDTPPVESVQNEGVSPPVVYIPPDNQPNTKTIIPKPTNVFDGVLKYFGLGGSPRWPSVIEHRLLAAQDAVDELYRIARFCTDKAGKPYIGPTEPERRQFFALARYAYRSGNLYGAKRIRNPGAAFTANVKNRRFKFASGADDEHARLQIAMIDRRARESASGLAAKLIEQVGQRFVVPAQVVDSRCDQQQRLREFAARLKR